jgi:ribosomal protein S18 acetylase RimI-like enzyme
VPRSVLYFKNNCHGFKSAKSSDIRNPMNSIVLIKASISDCNLICKIGAQSWLEAHSIYEPEKNLERLKYIEKAFSETQIFSELDDKNFQFYIVKKDNNPIGYVKINPILPELPTVNSPTIQIERFYLLKNQTGHGVGSAVLDQTKIILKQQGFKSLWLNVYTLNEPAIRFYEKSGFKKIGTKMFKLATTESLNWVYELEL